VNSARNSSRKNNLEAIIRQRRDAVSFRFHTRISRILQLPGDGDGDGDGDDDIATRVIAFLFQEFRRCSNKPRWESKVEQPCGEGQPARNYTLGPEAISLDDRLARIRDAFARVLASGMIILERDW